MYNFAVNMGYIGNKILYLEEFDDFSQGLLDLDGRNSQKYLHQTWAYF